MNTQRLKIILTVLAIALIGMYFSKHMMNKTQPSEEAKKSAQEVLDQNWDVRKIADTGIIALVPEKMKHIPTKLDEKAKETLKSYAAYEYITEPFALRINHVVARYDMSSDDYIKQLSKMIQHSNRLTDYDVEIGELEDGVIKGSFLKATGVQGEQEIAVNSVVIVNGANLREITISYYKNDARLVEKAQEIIKSITLE